MLNEVKVNTRRLRDDADKVDGYIKKIEEEITNMKTSIKELDRMWDGKSSEAFKKAINADIRELSAIVKGLKSIHSYEVNAKKKYEECEAKVGELVVGINT